MNLRILPQLDFAADNRPVGGDHDEGNPEPKPSRDSGLPFITVEAWQVEPGLDRLAGVPGLPVVDQVLFDGGAEPGAWLLVADGVIVARVKVGGTVEVCVEDDGAQSVEGRGHGNDRSLVWEAVSPSTTDEPNVCPECGWVPA